MTRRGTYGFEVDSSGRLVRTPSNTKLLRKLLLDWSIIDGDGGPGAEPDGRGTWHVFCHLAAAAGIVRLNSGKAAWIGILFDQTRRRYAASVCWSRSGRIAALPLFSPLATKMLKQARSRGFIEGASRGRILDRTAEDPGDPKSTDRRQDYDQNPNSSSDGGPVWEMWSASRNVVSPRGVGHSLVAAYLDLLVFLGGGFTGVVARGRMEPEYGHLRQLRALVDSGLIDVTDALLDLPPVAIPSELEMSLQRARPEAFARAATELSKHRTSAYHMYSRKITSFAPAPLLLRLTRSLTDHPSDELQL